MQEVTATVMGPDFTKPFLVERTFPPNQVSLVDKTTYAALYIPMPPTAVKLRNANA